MFSVSSQLFLRQQFLTGDNQSDDKEKRCSICLNDCEPKNKNVLVHEGREGRLWHPTHEECLNQWFKLKGHLQCATCKDSLLPSGIFLDSEQAVEHRKKIIQGLEKGRRGEVLDLLENGTPLCKETRIEALLLAAKKGDKEIVEKLLLPLFLPEDCGKAVVSAAANGHLEIVIFLLDTGVIPPEEYHKKAVGDAAANGHSEVVKLLIGSEGKFCGTALASAAANRHLELAEYLLSHFATSISEDDFEKAVVNAAIRGSSRLIESLLAMNPRKREKFIKLALMNAAANGHSSLVGILLNKNVPISSEERGTAVVNAAMGSHEKAVKRLLLGQGPDAISLKDRGEAVIQAAKNGHLEIIAFLLSQGAISLKDRGEAVVQAAVKGNLEILDLLLGQDTISLEDRGKAVGYAAEYGRYKTTKRLLLGQGPDAISIKDRGEAVIQAAKNGHLRVVRRLLDNGEILPKHRGLAVVGAASEGFEKVVEFLLYGGEISDRHYERAVANAAANGYLEVVLFLLRGRNYERKLCEKAVESAATEERAEKIIADLLLTKQIPISDDSRKTAVANAAVNGHLEIVKLLINGSDIVGELCGVAVVSAAIEGQEGFLETFLDRYKEIPIPGEDRKVAVTDAAANGRLEIAKLLINGSDIVEELCGVAVVSATAYEFEEIVEDLLRNYPISDEQREIAVIDAATNGRLEILKLLLQGDNVARKFYKIAILLAAEFAQLEVVRFLAGEASLEDLQEARNRAALGRNREVVEFLDGEEQRLRREEIAPQPKRRHISADPQ